MLVKTVFTPEDTLDAILELLQTGRISPSARPGEAVPVGERVPGGERAEHRAARMIFRKWLELRHRGLDLGLPLTDPLPGPLGSWLRVYRRGRIYWHGDPRVDVRLGAYVRRLRPSRTRGASGDDAVATARPRPRP